MKNPEIREAGGRAPSAEQVRPAFSHPIPTPPFFFLFFSTKNNNIDQNKFRKKRNSTDCRACAGRFKDVTGTGDCKPCEDGSYQPGVGKGNCIASEVGTFTSGTEKKKSEICQAGKYQDEPGQASCKECPMGRFNNDHATDVQYHDSVSDCELCAAGEYATKDLTKEDGIGSSSGAVTCLTCPPGKYSDAGSYKCDECPRGKANGEWGSVSSASCSPCVPGTYADELGMAVCAACTEGELPERFVGQEQHFADVTTRGRRDESCACKTGWTGDYCTRQECPATLPATSLGMLLLEASYPETLRVKGDYADRVKAVVSITRRVSGIFNTANTNGDLDLTEEEINAVLNFVGVNPEAANPAGGDTRPLWTQPDSHDAPIRLLDGETTFQDCLEACESYGLAMAAPRDAAENDVYVSLATNAGAAIWIDTSNADAAMWDTGYCRSYRDDLTFPYIEIKSPSSGSYIKLPEVKGIKAYSLWFSRGAHGRGQDYVVDARPALARGWLIDQVNSENPVWIGDDYVRRFDNGKKVSLKAEVPMPRMMDNWIHLYLEAKDVFDTELVVLGRYTLTEGFMPGRFAVVDFWSESLTDDEILQQRRLRSAIEAHHSLRRQRRRQPGPRP